VDSITQAALGAAIGETMFGEKAGSKAAAASALIATLPDLDVILHLFYSPLEMLSIHRGISHSILFSVAGAFLVAYILSRFKWTSEINWKQLWLFAWLALFTHILLDAFTTFGTQLLLPFSNYRVGFDSINVVDPIYTLPLLIGLLFSLWFFKENPRRSVPTKVGLIISTIYLLGTLAVKQKVNNYFAAALQKAEIEHTDLLTVPVGIGNLQWYGVAKSRDSIYMRKDHLLSPKDHTFTSFPINEHLLKSADPELVETMRWFAQGFYTVEEKENHLRFFNLQVDMRGIVEEDGTKAPTAGYFKVPKDGQVEGFSSGAIGKE